MPVDINNLADGWLELESDPGECDSIKCVYEGMRIGNKPVSPKCLFPRQWVYVGPVNYSLFCFLIVDIDFKQS